MIFLFLCALFLYMNRAAQRMANNNVAVAATATPSAVRNRNSSEQANVERGGFCGALQRTPPSMPSGLARRLAHKENYGLGKVSSRICEYQKLLEFDA